MPRPGSKGLRWLFSILCGSIGVVGMIQRPLQGEEARASNSTAVPAATEMRATLRKVVREAIPYDPKVREKTLPVKSAASDITTLETVTVVQSTETPGFRAYRDQKRREAEAAKPSLTRGVFVQVTPNMTAGLSPYKDILPFGDAKPRFTLLNLRF